MTHFESLMSRIPTPEQLRNIAEQQERQALEQEVNAVYNALKKARLKPPKDRTVTVTGYPSLSPTMQEELRKRGFTVSSRQVDISGEREATISWT